MYYLKPFIISYLTLKLRVLLACLDFLMFSSDHKTYQKVLRANWKGRYIVVLLISEF